jgi:hypothetical protein
MALIVTVLAAYYPYQGGCGIPVICISVERWLHIKLGPAVASIKQPHKAQTDSAPAY